MIERRNHHLVGRISALLVLTLTVSVMLAARPARADDRRDAQNLVDRSHMALDSFLADPHMGRPLHSLLRKAKGVLIQPQILRGAFLFGGAGGSGVFLVRDPKTGRWSEPAFYGMGQFSFGFQAGVDMSEVVLVALTERGVSALLSPSAKLGADASVAAGPIGFGAEAATENLSGDIVSYARAKGLYGGVSLEGAVITPRDGLNTAYYGKAVTPSDVLIMRTATNPHADSLVQALDRAAPPAAHVAQRG